MAKNQQDNKLIRTPNNRLIQDFIHYIKLIGLLIKDRRVNFFLKLLPIASLIYLIIPFDLAPGLTFPIIGALDDAAILWIGTSLFISLCPENVVEEHKRSLEKVITGTWKDLDEEVVEAESRDVTDDETKE